MSMSQASLFHLLIPGVLILEFGFQRGACFQEPMAGVGRLELRLTRTVAQGEIVDRDALRDAIECRILMQMVDRLT